MTQADSVHSTPPTNTPIDTTRRRFIAIAAGASIVSVGSLATVAMPATANVTSDPVFALIAQKRAADVTHGEAIDVYSTFESAGDYASEAALEVDARCEAACHYAMDVAWQLARTAPTTLGGLVAVLRFANQFEDEGNEWPDTDRVGSGGWHYQLRATMAAAIEALIKAQAGKAVA